MCSDRWQISGCPGMGLKAEWIAKGGEGALKSDGNVGF